MIRLFAMILMAPFWVHFLLAGGVAGFGHYLHNAESNGYAEKIRLAQAAPPEVMSITAFTSDAPRTFPVEVNLRAQVAIDHNVQLVKTKNGKTVSERAMYILVAPDAPSDTKLAYGAVILDPSEVDLFAAWAEGKEYTVGALGPVLTFDGLRDHPFQKSHIMDALQEQGFMAAADFTYIEPFLKGREAGLAIKPKDKPLDIMYSYYIAAFFVFMAILKFGLGLRGKGHAPSRKAPTATAMPMAEPQVVETIVAPAASALASNDFIGALARKAASSNAAKQVEPPSAIVSMTSKGASAGGTMRKLAGFGGALALYLVFVSFGGAFNIPSVQSLKGAFGLNSGMTEIIMTEAAPLSAADVVPLAVSQGQAAPLAVAQTRAAVVVMAPREAVAVVPAVKPVSMADSFRGIKAKLATGISAARAQIFLWRSAPPMWLWVSLLAAVLLMPALIILRQLPILGRKGAGKSSKIDPFERLLQRRLAENARGQKPVLGGAGLLRA